MEPEHVAAVADIRRHAKKALVLAGQDEIAFIDVDQVVAAVGLNKAGLALVHEDAPKALRKLMRSIPSRVLGLLAIPQKTIFVDLGLPTGRRRFTEAHEIGHNVMPWHEGAYFHDDATTLSPATKVDLEREANIFSSELLFGAGRFTAIADDFAPSLDVPVQLAQVHGTSVASAIRYYVEWSAHPVACIALSQYTRRSASGEDEVSIFWNQSFASPSFTKRYGALRGIFPGNTVGPKNGVYHLAQESRSVGQGSMGSVIIGEVASPIHAQIFNNGRLRYLMLSKSTRLSGRRLEIVNANGASILRRI